MAKTPGIGSGLPFRLNEGILLDDSDEVIAWGSKIRSCLDLPCDVSASRLFDPPDPRVFHIYLETFHFASLRWRGTPEWSIDEITRSFKDAYEHLRRCLGEASFSYPEYAYTEYGTPYEARAKCRLGEEWRTL